MSTLIARLGKQNVYNPKVADESPLCATYFLLTIVRLLAYVVTDEDQPSNDLSMMNQKEHTALRQDPYLKLICKLFRW